MVSSGMYVYYTVMGTCQTFTLRQGCYDYYYGPSTCSGSYVVTNALSVPSSTPSAAPTGPSLVPSASPRSTTLPTGPTQVPSYTTAVDCGDLASSYLNPVSCYFIACGGKYLTITPASYYTYAYLQLYDSSGERIQFGYNYMVLSTPVDSVCQTYTLKLECYNYYCTGSYKVFGGEPIFECLILISETECDSFPFRAPRFSRVDIHTHFLAFRPYFLTQCVPKQSTDRRSFAICIRALLSTRHYVRQYFRLLFMLFLRVSRC